MRAEFPAAAVFRRRSGAVTAALIALSLAACAHAGAARQSVAEGGEVALAPVAGSDRGAAYAPITLAELSGRAEVAVRPVVAPRTLAAPGLAAPAVRRSEPAADGVELWRGTYVGRTYGQQGAVALALRPSATGVRGTVAWRVTSAGAALGRNGGDAVTLVRVPVVDATRDAGQLVLHLDSYFDPACSCTAQATFRAAVRGDTLVGRFTIDGPATVVGEGRGHWRAVRVTP